LNIAILNCSSPFRQLDHHGSAADIIENWLAPQFLEAVFTEVNIAAGEDFPDLNLFDGIIVSGSEKGVYDECEWMEPLKIYLRSLKEAQVPIFGICFGHQVMAEAFGGKAEKADYGFVVGSREYTTVYTSDFKKPGAIGTGSKSTGSKNADSKNTGSKNTYSAYAMHKDQVVQVPDTATVTASASYCPVAALSYNFPARSVQFHPEFNTPLVTEAIEVFDGDLLTSDEAELSRQSMTGANVQESLYAKEIAEFFRHADR